MIGLSPIEISFDFNQSGESVIFTESRIIPEYLGHIFSSEISTIPLELSITNSLLYLKFSFVENFADKSLARPTIERQSTLLGVTSISKTVSEKYLFRGSMDSSLQ